MLDSKPYVFAITALAVALAEGQNSRDINQLSLFFTQLADTLATLAARAPDG